MNFVNAVCHNYFFLLIIFEDNNIMFIGYCLGASCNSATPYETGTCMKCESGYKLLKGK